VEDRIREKLAGILQKKYLGNEYNILFDPGTFPICPNIHYPGYAKYILEIGSGWGEFTNALAADHPDWFIIALEKKKKRVKYSIAEQTERGISNIRWVIINVDWFFEEVFTPESFDTIIINFPDPWPKKRHHKHRFMGKSFIHILHGLLKNNGELEFATDHREYMEDVLDIIEGMPQEWENIHGKKVVKSHIENRPESYFEREQKNKGMDVYFLQVKKLPGRKIRK